MYIEICYIGFNVGLLSKSLEAIGLSQCFVRNQYTMHFFDKSKASMLLFTLCALIPLELVIQASKQSLRTNRFHCITAE